jgi:NAD(P)-dependent dehydrogenase (short-subunit alcohol dehydrogenase family)
VTNLCGKTIFITGGSRGIGRAIALKAAADGANVVIAAKTSEPHPKLPGTIQTVAREIEAIGGKALPLQLDVRRDDDIRVTVAAVAPAIDQIAGRCRGSRSGKWSHYARNWCRADRRLFHALSPRRLQATHEVEHRKLRLVDGPVPLREPRRARIAGSRALPWHKRNKTKV